MIEVINHVNEKMIRGIAMSRTGGLDRNSLVVDTGHPMDVSVGDQLLVRVLDLEGNPIDGKGKLNGGEKRPIFQSAPSLEHQTTKTELFETGIKVIDLLAPIERGSKSGLFGGAGVE